VVFADSSGLIAVFNAADVGHEQAAKAWQALARRRRLVLTTQLVFAETVTFLRRRVGWQASRTVGDAMLRSRVVEVAGVSDEQLASGWRELLRSGDPKLSLCDAVSFVLMRERGVSHVLTFDPHFADAGFELLP
jgi:predicted nucleic acid-binding protein